MGPIQGSNIELEQRVHGRIGVCGYLLTREAFGSNQLIDNRK